MVKVAEMPAIGRGFISELEMPKFESQPWTTPVPATQRRAL